MYLAALSGRWPRFSLWPPPRAAAAAVEQQAEAVVRAEAEVARRDAGQLLHLQVGGDASGKYLITSDLPLQGSSSHQTTQMNQAIEMILEAAQLEGRQVHGRSSSRATTRRRRRGRGTRRRARRTPTRTPRIRRSSAYIGTFNSGCAELEIPVLNQAQPGGPIAMVSPANTWPGLTQRHQASRPSRASTTRPARATTPASWPPTTSRARRSPSSHRASASRAVYILNDKQAYGVGVAHVLRGRRQEARHQGRSATRPTTPRRAPTTRPCCRDRSASTPTRSWSAA